MPKTFDEAFAEVQKSSQTTLGADMRDAREYIQNEYWVRTIKGLMTQAMFDIALKDGVVDPLVILCSYAQGIFQLGFLTAAKMYREEMPKETV